MDLRLTDEQTQLVASFKDLFGKHSAPEAVRESEATGVDVRLWQALRETGVVEMALPEAVGGWGATLLDLALVAEQAGESVAPAPIIEAQVAARLLAAVDHEMARAALADVLEGDAVPTVALHPVRRGVAGLVPAGSVARYVIARSGVDLVLVDTEPLDVTPVALSLIHI